MKTIIKTVKIQKNGPNAFITIPIVIVRESGLQTGDTMLIKYDGEKIIAEKC